MSTSEVSKIRRAGLLARLALAALLGLMVALLAASSYDARSAHAIPMCDVPDPPPICDGPEEPPDPSFYYTRKSAPARTEVTDPAGNWLATFTDGAYTVTLKGPGRTFRGTAPYPVTHSTWVRVLPKPFDGRVDEAWLQKALADTSPDVLQLAMQYIEGAPPIEVSGRKIAGDAKYGPCSPGYTEPCPEHREEGSDFNDYMGIPWTYGTASPDQPETAQIGSLDCSGYVRMVFGYRSNLPLTLSPNGTAIPRRAYQILNSAPGVVTVPNAGTQVQSFAKLVPGDLVFFDADNINDGTQIDHVGVYLGRDAGGNQRFVSSRKYAVYRLKDMIQTIR